MLTLSRRGAFGLAAAAAAATAVGVAHGQLARIMVRGNWLRYGETRLRCAIGRGGMRPDKREGDGATPTGIFPLREVFYRPDRVAKPETDLPVRALSPQDGWCDDPHQPRYNQLVSLPFAAHHEELWRTDGLYDLLVVIGFNDLPVVPGRGSAVFLHVASPGWGPTDGCVAVLRGDLERLLAACAPGIAIDIA